MKELGDVILHAIKFNSPTVRSSGPTIKYIDPHIDCRDGSCFSITFRKYGSEQVFSTTNENIENPNSLYDRCMKFLTTGEIT